MGRPLQQVRPRPRSPPALTVFHCAERCWPDVLTTLSNPHIQQQRQQRLRRREPHQEHPTHYSTPRHTLPAGVVMLPCGGQAALKSGASLRKRL